MRWGGAEGSGRLCLSSGVNDQNPDAPSAGDRQRGSVDTSMLPTVFPDETDSPDLPILLFDCLS